MKVEGVVAKEIEGQMVLLKLDTGDYLVLNESGTFIWNQLRSLSTPEIVNQLKERYGIDDATAAFSVGEFLGQLKEAQLL